MYISVKTGFLPIVPFEGEHPEMLIAAYTAAEAETFGNGEYSQDTECWD